jgi:hypothetical protein
MQILGKIGNSQPLGVRQKPRSSELGPKQNLADILLTTRFERATYALEEFNTAEMSIYLFLMNIKT